MTTTLFNIQTIVEAKFNENRLQSVTITAAKAVRSRIWDDFATNDRLNPGVARYDGGAPTVITLTPYPGYANSDLVAQMAFAFACLAHVDDWETVFATPLRELVIDQVQVRGFEPDRWTTNQFQNLYLGWKVIRTLRNLLSRLKNVGLNTHQIYLWETEAAESLRRLTSPSRPGVEELVNHVAAYADQVRDLDATKTTIRRELERLVDQLAAEIDAPSLLGRREMKNSFHALVRTIEIEDKRLKSELELWRPIFDQIQLSLMPRIRKATPPAPPAAKK